MSIFRMLRVTEQIQKPSAAPGPNEDIRLDRAEDMDMVRAFVAVLRDEPDSARSLVRDMSPGDRALLSFNLGELSRLVSEEEDFRRAADRQAARRGLQGDTDGW